VPPDDDAAKPAINDQFWFDYSKKLVTEAIQSRTDAGAKIQTLTIWLWGIYTASASVGVALSKMPYSPAVIILIALPVPMLIAAYWMSVWAQLPVIRPDYFKPDVAGKRT
jgi:hypothetical protein